MMKTINLLFTVLVLLAISGCASKGNQRIMNADFMQSLKIGVTTPDEVRALLGEPQHRGETMAGNREVWRYAGEDRSINAAAFIPIVDLAAGRVTSRARVVDLYFEGGKLADIQAQSDMSEKIAPIGTVGAVLGAAAVGTAAAASNSYGYGYGPYYGRGYYRNPGKVIVNTIPGPGGSSMTTIKWYK